MSHEQAVLVTILAVEGDPLAIRRPERAAGGIVAAETRGFVSVEVYHPELAVGATGDVMHSDCVSDVVAVRRKRHAADITQLVEIGTGQDFRL